MPTYEVRNRRSKMVLGEVIAERPDEVLDALLDSTGSTVEDVALSLGGSLDEIAKALDIIEVKIFQPATEKYQPSRPIKKKTPARRKALYVDQERG